MATSKARQEFRKKETEHFIEGCRIAMNYLDSLKNDPKAQDIVKTFRREWIKIGEEFKTAKRAEVK